MDVHNSELPKIQLAEVPWWRENQEGEGRRFLGAGLENFQYLCKRKLVGGLAKGLVKFMSLLLFLGRAR